MARWVLLFAPMRTKPKRERRCSYVVVAQNAATSAGELKQLANYLSTLGLAGAEVVVLDPSPRLQFEHNTRVLRWVGRHVAVRPEWRTPLGTIDPVRAAVAVAGSDKIIVATEDVRYTPEAIGQMCDLLDLHEVVEPQDYLDPLPWWGGIEAGRILLHRGIEPQPDHGATFGLRRTVVRALRNLPPSEVIDHQPRRLAAAGAEVHPAGEVFVRRQPGPLDEWLSGRPRQAGDDFAIPVKSAFFFALLPLLMLLTTLGGIRLAGGYAGVIAFASMAIAFRGRFGAQPFFPLRAVLFAPLWVFERSVSVYWALFRKLRGLDEPQRVAVPESQAPKARMASSSDS